MHNKPLFKLFHNFGASGAVGGRWGERGRRAQTTTIRLLISKSCIIITIFAKAILRDFYRIEGVEWIVLLGNGGDRVTGRMSLLRQ